MPFEVEHAIEIPVGEFLRAKLSELEHVVIPYVDKKTNENKTFGKLNWKFEITQQGEFTGKDVRGETSDDLTDSPYNKFRQWAESLLGRQLGVGQVLQESDLEGLSGLITVKREQDRKDPSKFWTRVDDVIPLDPSADDEPPF